MAIESLVARLWELNDFFIRTRIPAKVENGWTDIDVVGIDARGTLRLAECKARGGAELVLVPQGDFAEWLASREWDGVIDRPRGLWAMRERPYWLPAQKDISALEVWFVGNLWFPSDTAHAEAEESWTRTLKAAAPKALRARTHGRVLSTLEVIALLLERVEHMVVEERLGRRYGDPFLDAIREIVRYLHARPSGGGHSSRAIRAASQRRLAEALGLPMA